MARHSLRSPPRRRRTVRTTRRWLILGIILLLGGGGWWYWRNQNGPIHPSPEVRPAPRSEALSPPPTIGPITNAIPPPVPVLAEPRVKISAATPETNLAVGAMAAPTNSVPFLPAPEVSLDSVPNRGPTNILEAQIALTAYGIGSGPIDGIGGAQTALALRAFQFQHGLEETGRLDPDTQAQMKLTRPLWRSYTITTADLASLVTVPSTWLGKSELSRLGYQSALELVAEQSHANPTLLRRLNPSVNWDHVAPGTTVTVPNADYPPARRAALLRIRLANRFLRAFDDRGNLLAHFPCSIGRIAEKRPVGQLNVIVTVKDPNYTFDPAVFPESEEARQIGRKLVIAPGPNNPVGLAWIGLNRPGYGIHGTPVPEQVGRTESHGCFRLANWNAEYLRQMVTVGTPVWVEP